MHTVSEGWRNARNNVNDLSSNTQAKDIPIHKPTCGSRQVLDQVEFGVHKAVPVTRRQADTKYSFEEVREKHTFGMEDVSTETDPGCTPTTAVCIPDRRVWHKHFAHVTQRIMPCFSVFRRIHPNLKWVVVQEGVEKDRADMSSWNKELLKYTQIEVRDNATMPECKVTSTIRPSQVAYAFQGKGPMYLHWKMGLSRRVAGESADHFKVGVLNRIEHRHWSGSSDFIDIASKEFPHAEFEETYFEDFSFMEQAQWVNKQDIIITPHGAQETNLLFARRCMGVIELSPMNYYVPRWYASLANGLGAQFYGGYPEGHDGQNETKATWDCCRLEKRSTPIEASPDSVLTFLKQAVAQQTRCYFEDTDVTIGQSRMVDESC